MGWKIFGRKQFDLIEALSLHLPGLTVEKKTKSRRALYVLQLLSPLFHKYVI
jgi:hypothetical protein